MFDGELFADFVLLYLVCHESRFEAHDDGGPQSCYLEQLARLDAEQGERALDQLRERRGGGDLDPRHRVPLPSGESPAPGAA